VLLCGGVLLLPYAPWLCWLTPIIGAMLTPLFTIAPRKIKKYAPVAFVAAGLVFSVSLIPDALTGNMVDYQIPWTSSLGVNLGVLVDPLSVLMSNIVNCVGLLVTIFSLEYMRGEPGLTRYWFFTQLFIGGLSLVVMADNLLLLYIGWEIVGVCCCAMVTFWYKDSQKAHYGLKTFMILRVGDVLLLASILIMYTYSHTFDFASLQNDISWIRDLSTSGLLLVTALMFFGGAIAKSAQFPLHVWLPDAMPSTPASFNAITEVLAGVYLVARTLPMFHSALGNCGELALFFLAVAWVGVFTALLGASMAVVQRNLIRVLAYSIISQYALMIVGLGVGGLMINPAVGYLAGNLHLMADAIISGLLFLSAAAILHTVHSEDMFDMGGLKARMPITFKCMIIGALATIGIPPLSGFWSEESIYNATLKLAQEANNQGNFNLMLSAYGLYILLLITAAVTTFYILRMIGLVFGQKSKHIEKLEKEGKPIKEVSPLMWIPMGIVALATIIMGVLAPFIIGGFHEFFSPLLHQGITPNSIIDVITKTFLSPTFGITCAALAVGGYPAYQMYIAHRVNPDNVTSKHLHLKKIHTFLRNRCYINTLYYKIADETKLLSKVVHKRLELGSIDAFNYAVAGFFKRISKAAHKKLELGGIDALNYLIAQNTVKFCQTFRKTHTGVLSWNMVWVMLGITLLSILLFVFGGHIP